MLLFVLLLISTGFMYFYYQKCQAQDRELTRLRSGEPAPQEQKMTTVSRSPLRDVANAMRDRLIATPAVRRTPAVQAEPPQREKVQAEPPETASRPPDPASTRVKVAEATPEPDAIETQKRREKNGIAQASDSGEARTGPAREDTPESAAPDDPKAPKATTRSTRTTKPKPTPAVKVKIPKRTPAPKAASTDDVENVLRSSGASSSE
jgi:hypothetical protein